MISVRKTSLSAFVLLLLWAAPVLATSILHKIRRTDEQGRLQIFLRLNTIPEYRLTTTGKRIELLLLDTIAAKNIQLLREDDRLIKMLIRKQKKGTALSFYFRYPPQKVQINTLKDTSSLMLDIILGSPLTTRYQDLAARLPGLTMVASRTTDYTNPLNLSRYATDWRLFFEEYESPVTISPKPDYSLPPFPLARFLLPAMSPEHWLPAEAESYASERKWDQAVAVVRETLDQLTDSTIRERMLLAYAELLVRSNGYTEPYQLLQQIMYTWPDTQTALLAKYLFIYLQARQEDPHLAWFELKKQEKKFLKEPGLRPFFIIFQAELALATGRADQAGKILARDDMAFTGKAELLRLLRQADTRYLLGKKISALVSYLQLLDRSEIIATKPLSLAQFCDTLYVHYRYRDAARWYQKLTALLNDKEDQDLAMFRLAMSRLHSGASLRAILPMLQEIREAFPDAEGKYRAWLKQTDLEYLNHRRDSDLAAQTYGVLTEEAPVKKLREEALFKEALVYALSGNNEKAVALAMQKLREFRSGDLNLEARALLIQRVPLVIDDLLKRGEYIKALVLARENRELFTRGWLGTEILFKLGRAYTELGIFERAARVYLYILDVSPEPKRQEVYLPLLQSLYASGRYDMLEDYADQYILRYPESPNLDKIFLLRLKALKKRNKLQKAAKILDRNDWPRSRDTLRTAAAIYFDLNRWNKVVELLEDPLLDQDRQDPEVMYQLAESLYQLDRLDQASEIFTVLAEGDRHRETALFRLAQIYERNGHRDKALNEYRRLAEETKDPLWRKAALEGIDLLQMQTIN
ncbi:tetratricopeptide repeat protein [Desulfolithobacter sp.]